MLATALLASCDRKKSPSPPNIDPPPVEKVEQEGSGESTPSAETSEQITKRLLDAPFQHPRDVQPKSGLPPISLDPDLVELGDMMPNTKKSGTLTLTNVGDEPIRILALRSTCACTVPGIESDIVAPKESITIALELDAKSATGPNQRYIMALFEGYQQPVQLIVQADVNYGIRTRVTYDPPGQSRVATIQLQSTDESVPFRIISAGGEAPVFVGGFDPSKDEPRTKYTIRQDYSMYASEQLPRWFLIETDHPTSAVIDVPVPNYEIQPERQRHRFNVSESRLVFGQMHAGEQSFGRFRVVGGDLPDASEFVDSIEWTNTDQCDVEVVSAENDEGGIQMVIGVTPKEGLRGVLFGTVTLRAMGDSRPFDIIGRVVAPE